MVRHVILTHCFAHLAMLDQYAHDMWADVSQVTIDGLHGFAFYSYVEFCASLAFLRERNIGFDVWVKRPP